jgi:hypothetical protein
MEVGCVPVTHCLICNVAVSCIMCVSPGLLTVSTNNVQTCLF